MSKPTCFVMMPFKPKKRRKSIRKAIAKALEPHHLACDVADNPPEDPQPGQFLDKIREGIQRALVCIADITGNNANVAYELGLANGQQKCVILITEDSPKKAVADYSGQPMIRFSTSSTGLRKLQEDLRARLPLLARRERIRVMLVPNAPRAKSGRFVIAANPLSWRDDRGREGGWSRLGETRVEYVGIQELLLEFGALGEVKPKLLNPSDYLDEVVRIEPMNLYCLGSPKANRWTGELLKEFNKRWSPAFEFKPDPDSREREDPTWCIEKDGERYDADIPRDKYGTADFKHDFGLIIRGPNPFDPDHMLIILAGRRGTGTEAACRAVTDVKILGQIHAHLVSLDNRFDLSDFRTPFFAVVEMKLKEVVRGQWDADLPTDSKGTNLPTSLKLVEYKGKVQCGLFAPR
jgi:hypothetical protein